MYTQIEDSNTTHTLLLTAHTCPVGSDHVSTTYTIKVTEHDYVTRYCAITLTIDNAESSIAGIAFAAAYEAHRAFVNHDPHVLLNPNEPNSILQYLLHKLPHGNGHYNKVADVNVKTWSDYKSDTQLSDDANERIDALMELELTDEPIVPVEVTGKTEATTHPHAAAIEALLDNGVCVDDEDMIPDSGYDGLYA